MKRLAVRFGASHYQRESMRTSRQPKLRVESLEKRLLMAGNVTVSQSGADLIIQGDNSDNSLEVIGTGVAGQFVVVGEPSVAGGTAINGVVNGAQTFNGVTNDITIKLAGGDDFLIVNNVATGRDLNIDMGDGANEMQLGDGGAGSLGTGRDLNINAAGQLDLQEDRVFLQRDQNISITGGFNDSVFITSGSNRDLNVHTNGGNDVVNINLLTNRRNLLIDTGSDNDLISMIQTAVSGDATFQHGNNGLGFFALDTNNFAKTVTVKTGGGNDTVQITNSLISGTTSVTTGGGDDVVLIDDTVAATVNIDTGNGADGVTTESSRINSATITLGSGNDGMIALNNAVGSQASVDGGSGFDTIEAAGNLGRVKTPNFEAFI